ncbi:MAG: hypothetical protein J6O50_16075 [Ruminiclostridium sp.]|nr:hypothetical protein [Ruminiclostridium sp.]
MSDFFDWLFHSEILDTIFGLTLIFGLGLYMYGMNWYILLYNNIPKLNPEGRFVSMVPPLGGLLIAVGILLIGGGWWALVGLTDPFIGCVIYALLTGRFGNNRKSDKEDKENHGE